MSDVCGEGGPGFEALRVELEADLAPHMMKEERVLFPFIAAMAATPAGTAIPVPFGTVRNPIRMMELEHDTVGGLLADSFDLPLSAVQLRSGESARLKLVHLAGDAALLVRRLADLTRR